MDVTHSQDPKRPNYTLCGQPLKEVDKWSGPSWDTGDCPKCLFVKQMERMNTYPLSEQEIHKPKKWYVKVFNFLFKNH